jgi:hypothetical protein
MHNFSRKLPLVLRIYLRRKRQLVHHYLAVLLLPYGSPQGFGIQPVIQIVEEFSPAFLHVLARAMLDVFEMR